MRKSEGLLPRNTERFDFVQGTKAAQNPSVLLNYLSYSVNEWTLIT